MPVVLKPNKKASEIDKNTVAEIAASLKIARPIAEVLYTRGFDSVEKAAGFINAGAELHLPQRLPGIKEAADTLLQAIYRNEHITVYGDYDVDGICAVSVMLLVLRHLQADVDYYIPDRHTEGYGLNSDAVSRISKKGGVLLTVDCGIASHAEVALAVQNGMKVIVTDHHTVPEQIPECIVINPHIPSDYPFSELCGAGVAFKLAQQLLGKSEYFCELLDLAAIATVADMVPLTGENRAIVKMGLERINSCPRPGLLELIKQSGKTPGRITSVDIAFAIAPRLNAAGRLESAELGVELLTGAGNAQEISATLCRLNTVRQELEQQVIEQAEEIVLRSGQVRDRRVLVAASDWWEKGVVGIAASQMAARHHRPCILFSVENGIATGSGRSVEGINMYSMLQSINDLLLRFGGHAMAAGLSIDADRLDEAAYRLDCYVKENYDELNTFPVARYDARACLSEMDMGLARQIELLAPFGMGNPSPKFRIDGLRASCSKAVGKTGAHLKLTLSDELTSTESMMFSYKNRDFQLVDGMYYTVTGAPDINVWNDTEKLSFIVDASRPERTASALEEVLRLNDEKFVRAFFHQIMYNNGEEECQYEALESFEELTALLDGLLSQSATGTVIICNHPAIVPKIAEFIYSGYPRCDVELFSSASQKNGYNTFAAGCIPENMELVNFSNVVLCDSCTQQMIAAVSKAAPEAEIYAFMQSPKELTQLIAKRYRDFSRSGMGVAYGVLRAACEKLPPCRTREEFMQKAADGSPRSRVLLDIALSVFEELGFFKCECGDNGFSVVFNRAAPANPLANSGIYKNICGYSSCGL